MPVLISAMVGALVGVIGAGISFLFFAPAEFLFFAPAETEIVGQQVLRIAGLEVWVWWWVALVVDLLLIGLLPGFILGGFMGLSATACAQDRFPTQPLWGIVTGGVIGLSFGAIPGLAVSIANGFSPGHVVASFVAAVVAGVVGWQAAYMSSVISKKSVI